MVKRKTEKSPLTKSMFHEVNRTIKEALAGGVYSATQVAEHHGVSDSTVRSVRRTGTWPKYQEEKEARNVRRGRVHGVAVPPVEPAERTSPTPDVEMKTLTKAEYDDLMELKETVDGLQTWHDNMFKQEIENIAKGYTADEFHRRLKAIETVQTVPPVALKVATPVKRKRGFLFRSRG